MRQRHGRGGRQLRFLWDRRDFDLTTCGSSELMSRSLAAKTASSALPLLYTLLAEGVQLRLQGAFDLSQLMSKVTNEKGRK